MRRILLIAAALFATSCSKARTTETTAGPSTALLVTPAALSGPEVSFAFVSSTPGATFRCVLDGGAAADCTSPHPVRGLASGEHTFSAAAVDAAGVADPLPPTFSWKVDAAPPATAITAHPAAQATTGAATFSFTSSKEGSTFRCTLDGAGPEACTSPRSFTLADGAHDFSAQAVDAVGNVDPAPARFAWTVTSGVAPETTFSATPAALSNGTATFAFVSGTAGATFLCSLDGAAATACTSPVALTGLSTGAHTFTAAATSAGRTDATPASHSWTVDATPPATTITAQPPGTSANTTASFSFAANERPATFLCTLDGLGPSPCTSPRIATLGAGAHLFTVAAVDQVGNVDPAPPTASFTITATTSSGGAAALITNGPSNPSSATTASFWFSATPAGATFTCALDGAAPTACTSPRQYTGLAQGTHAFQVVASVGGVAQANPPTYSWTIDGIPPQTLITARPVALMNSATPSFSFTSSKLPSSFACRIDQGALFACNSPYTSGALADGSHAFLVVATDAAGNLDPYPPTATWTQDTAAPHTTLTSTPANPTNSLAPVFQFTSSKPTSGYLCSLDGSAFAACTSPDARTVAAGAHAYAVAAVDLAGNRDQAPATFSWTVDTAAPVVTLRAPLPASPTRLPAATFTFDANKSGSAFRCSLDGAAEATCGSPMTYAGLSSAAHTFSVVATDPAGNSSAPAGHAWTVDLVAPAASITASPSNPSNVTSPSFAFTSSKAGSTFTCSLDGAPATACSSPQGYAGLSAGLHTFAVIATDPVGNPSNVATYGWRIDTAAPAATIDAAPASLNNQRAPSISFSSSKAGSSFTCALDGSAALPCSSPKGYAGLADGPHSFTVVAIDAAGNPSNPATAAWTLDTVLPVATLDAAGQPPSITNQTGASFSFSSTKTGSFTCTLDGASAPCVSPKSYAGLSSASHAFSVVATDLAGNGSAAAGYGWSVDTVAPTVTLTGRPGNPSKASATSFSFVSSKAGGAFTCSLDGAQFASCASPASAGPLGDGPHTFAVIATDPAGNPSAPASYGWTVDTQAPQTPGGLTVAAGNRSLQISWAPVGDAASYSVRYGLTPGLGTAVSVPAGTSASLTSLSNCQGYSVTVVAIDAAGNESLPAAVITAAPALPAPASASASGQSGIVSLTWAPVTNASGYRVYYGAGKGGPYSGTNALDGASPLSRTGTTTTLNGLPPFDKTYVTVAAVDGACEGPKSAEVLSTPVPWRSLNPLPTDKALRAISCAPGGLPCAAVGDSGVALFSVDGFGWSRAYSATAGGFSAVQMVTATVGYAISGTDVYKSTTGGSAWVKTSGSITPARSIFALSFADASVGLVASAAGVVLRTADGGATWTATDTGTLANWFGVYLSPDAQTALAVGQSGVIRQSLDGGLTWANRTSNTGVDLNAVACGSAGSCWAAGSGGAITASTNGGASWTAQASGTSNVIRGLAFASGSTGWAVGDGGVLRATVDGGATWSGQASGETGALRGAAVGAGSAYFVGDGGILRRATDGATWVSQRTILTAAQLNRVLTFGTDGVLVVGNGGLVLRSLDGAATWASANPTSANLLGLWFVDGATAFAVGASGTILKTGDAGATWTAQASGVTFPLNDIHCLDAQTCFAVGKQTLLATSDGGANWTSRAIATGGPTSAELVSVRFSDLNHGFVGVGYEGGGNPSNFLRTIDGGVFWQNSSFDVSGHGSNGGFGGIYAIFALDSSRLIITANSAAWGQGTLARSSDGGASWQAVAGGGPTFRGLAAKGGVYAATQNSTVWLSSDGSSWTPTDTGSSGSLRSVAIGDASTLYAIGDGGAIFKTVTGGR